MAVDTPEKRRAAAAIFLPLLVGVTLRDRKDREWRRYVAWSYFFVVGGWPIGGDELKPRRLRRLYCPEGYKYKDIEPNLTEIMAAWAPETTAPLTYVKRETLSRPIKPSIRQPWMPVSALAPSVDVKPSITLGRDTQLTAALTAIAERLSFQESVREAMERDDEEAILMIIHEL